MAILPSHLLLSIVVPLKNLSPSVLGAWCLLLPSYPCSGHRLSRQAHESLGRLHSGCGARESGQYQWAVCVRLRPVLASALTSISRNLLFCALKGLDQEEMDVRGYVYLKYPGFTIYVVRDDSCLMS